MGVLKAVRKAHNASSNLSDQEARFSPMVLSKIRFKPRFETSTCPLVCGLQSFILPFSDKLSPIMTVCSGYYGWIATLIPSVAAGSLGGRTFFVLPPFRTPLVLWYCCVLSLFFLLLGILAFRER
nr:hypothetical protein [Tanacetum cinerariifolium]